MSGQKPPVPWSRLLSATLAVAAFGLAGVCLLRRDAHADLEVCLRQDVVELKDGTKVECFILISSPRGVLVVMEDLNPPKPEGETSPDKAGADQTPDKTGAKAPPSPADKTGAKAGGKTAGKAGKSAPGVAGKTPGKAGDQPAEKPPGENPAEGGGKEIALKQEFIPAEKISRIIRGAPSEEATTLLLEVERGRRVIRGAGTRPPEAKKVAAAPPVNPGGPVAPVLPLVPLTGAGSPGSKLGIQLPPGKATGKDLAAVYATRFPAVVSAAERVLGGSPYLAAELQKALEGDAAVKDQVESLLDALLQTTPGGRTRPGLGSRRPATGTRTKGSALTPPKSAPPAAPLVPPPPAPPDTPAPAQQ